MQDEVLGAGELKKHAAGLEVVAQGFDLFFGAGAFEDDVVGVDFDHAGVVVFQTGVSVVAEGVGRDFVQGDLLGGDVAGAVFVGAEHFDDAFDAAQHAAGGVFAGEGVDGEHADPFHGGFAHFQALDVDLATGEDGGDPTEDADLVFGEDGDDIFADGGVGVAGGGHRSLCGWSITGNVVIEGVGIQFVRSVIHGMFKHCCNFILFV